MKELEIPEGLANFIKKLHSRIWYQMAAYKGPSGAIWGHIREIGSWHLISLVDKQVYSPFYIVNDSEYTFVPKGTVTLFIHFNPKGLGDIRPAKNFAQKIDFLRIGLWDYMDFLDKLEADKRLKKVNVVAGITNPRVANIAVRRLGFHTCSELAGFRSWIWREVLIAAKPQELIAKREELENSRSKLLSA